MVNKISTILRTKARAVDLSLGPRLNNSTLSNLFPFVTNQNYCSEALQLWQWVILSLK
jgi:hypothetical protein